MKKFIRNDYTFIKRLESLKIKYRELENKYSLGDAMSTRYFKRYLDTDVWIYKIKEDMKLMALQKINDGEVLKKEYTSNFRGFTKEESDRYYEALNKIYVPLDININNI